MKYSNRCDLYNAYNPLSGKIKRDTILKSMGYKIPFKSTHKPLAGGSKPSTATNEFNNLRSLVLL